MIDKENNLLVSWLEGTLSIQEKTDIATEYDLENLHNNLVTFQEFSLGFQSVDRSWAEFEEKISNNKATPNKLFYFIYALLLLAIGFGSYLFYQHFQSNSQEKFQTFVGEEYAGLLPDGSTFQLNAVTKFSYFTKRWTERRKVFLEGEAYFEVQKGSTFEVITNVGKVKVLGTKFDVHTYNNFIIVSCYEGSVNVSNMKHDSITITHGQRVEIIDDRFTEIRELLTEGPEWKNKLLKFENVTLDFICREMKKYYDFEFEISKENQSKFFTGYIPTNDFLKSIDLICTPLQIKYKLSGKKLVL